MGLYVRDVHQIFSYTHDVHLFGVDIRLVQINTYFFIKYLQWMLV
jgi:hypothetical protein